MGYFEGHDVWVDGKKLSVGVGKLAVSHDGKYALTGDDSGVAILWEIDTFKILWRIPPEIPEEQRHRYKYPPSGPFGGSINAATGEMTFADGSPIPPKVASVAFFPDGSKFIVAYSHGLTIKGLVRVFDTQWGWEVARLGPDEQSSGIAGAVAVSPDGHWLLLATNPYPKLWDWRSGKVIELHGHTRHYPNPTDEPGGVRSVAFSPDGKLAITGGNDGTIRHWQVPQK